MATEDTQDLCARPALSRLSLEKQNVKAGGGSQRLPGANPARIGEGPEAWRKAGGMGRIHCCPLPTPSPSRHEASLPPGIILLQVHVLQALSLWGTLPSRREGFCTEQTLNTLNGPPLPPDHSHARLISTPSWLGLSIRTETRR